LDEKQWFSREGVPHRSGTLLGGFTTEEPAAEGAKEKSNFRGEREIGGHADENAEHQPSDRADPDCGSGTQGLHPIDHAPGFPCGTLWGVKVAAAIVLLAVSIAIWGCGDNGDDPEPPDVIQPMATTGCTNAMLTKRSSDWRRGATALGRIGFYGSGRNFLRGPKRTKVPVVVEGNEPVTVTIAARDRGHARLVVGSNGGWPEVVQARFVPCRDRPETWWPAGFVLRNREPVALQVRQGDEGPQLLQIGRI
jgi:hypothetical protein